MSSAEGSKHSPVPSEGEGLSDHEHDSHHSNLTDYLETESEFEFNLESDRESGGESGESEEEHEHEHVYNVDSETVEDITNMLSQIQLVWPENLPGFDGDDDRDHPRNSGYPSSYYECTDKEKAALWHAENFRQQFAYLYPLRRPLYLAPRNDCGVQKLFSTYINPTVLGYPEFYDYDTIMEFLKDYLTPELLHPPDLLPVTIRSPLTSLKIRAANIFEYALTAASFLIGAGFDAFVVDGYASKAIATACTTGAYNEDEGNAEQMKIQTQIANEKDLENSLTAEESSEVDIYKDEDAIPEVLPSKYKMPNKQEVKSNYLTAMQKRVDDKAEEEKIKADEEAAKEAERNKRPPTPDIFEGHRVHAWILILPGKRGVLKPFFLEPFSGTTREINDTVFLGIEAIFNNANYYVNHQDCQGVGIDKLSFDLNDKTNWSKLLYEPPPKKRANPLGQDFQDEEEDDNPETIEMFLDMPVSWVGELEITQEEYDLKYADGKKTENYDDAIVEIASPFVNLDGLTKKVIKFASKSRKVRDIVHIEEWFMNRKDKLIRRKWVRDGRMVYEYFDKGRRDSLKEHHHVAGRNNPDHPRKLYFYSDSHSQNVTVREVIPPKGIIEHFNNRDDKLYYRVTQFGKILCFTIPPKKIQESGVRALLELMTYEEGGAKNRTRRKILKIHEKFYRDPSKDYKEDISEKHMLLEDHLLRVMFHYGEGSITRNTMEFSKNSDDEFDIKESFEYRADPFSHEMDEYTKFKVLKSLLKEETRSSTLAREADDEIYTIVKQRVQEDFRHEIEPDEFAGDRSKQFMQQRQVQTTGGEGYNDDLTGIDFATPYIEKHGVPTSKEEEIMMKKRIVYHMKKRILKQAQTMQSSFDHESGHLKAKLDWYNSIKHNIGQTEEEIFNAYYKETIFRMYTIKQRLVRHIERAPATYYTLIYRILDHPLLNNFTKKRILTPSPVEDVAETNKMLKAKELEKLNKDCCQFFNFKFKDGVQENLREAKSQI